MDTSLQNIIEKIKNGGVGILPTDTMYGIVASASNPEAIEKLYAVRHRNPQKQSIVLISSLEDLKQFNIVLNMETENILNKMWPGPFSVEFEVSDTNFPHLTRSNGKFAVRFPKNETLLNLIRQSGPIIAPSANTEGDKPAENLNEAKAYFPNLDFYLDGGVLENKPSTVVSIVDGKIKVWRQGQGIVPPELML